MKIPTATAAIGGDALLHKLKALGIPPHRTIIGHSCGSTDSAYHRRIVDGGAYIGFDRFGMVRIQSDGSRIAHMHSLLEDGYAQQMIVSHDCAFCQRGRAVSDDVLMTDAMHFSRDIAPRLADLGVSEATLESILRDNPRRFFTGEPPVRDTAKHPAVAAA